MKWAVAFFRWLGTPIREGRALFPFTREGRATLIYLIFAGAGPALTLMALRVLSDTKGAKWEIYSNMADKIGYALLIIVAALGTYVAWQKVNLTKEGLKAERNDSDETVPAALNAAGDALKDKADEIKGGEQ